MTLQTRGWGCDAAYVASRALTHELFTSMHPEHRWDRNESGLFLARAHGALCAVLEDPRMLGSEVTNLIQRHLNQEIQTRNKRVWLEQCAPEDRVRHQVYVAKGAGKLYELTPSAALDMQLKEGEAWG